MQQRGHEALLPLGSVLRALQQVDDGVGRPDNQHGATVVRRAAPGLRRGHHVLRGRCSPGARAARRQARRSVDAQEFPEDGDDRRAAAQGSSARHRESRGEGDLQDWVMSEIRSLFSCRDLYISFGKPPSIISQTARGSKS